MTAVQKGQILKYEIALRSLNPKSARQAVVRKTCSNVHFFIWHHIDIISTTAALVRFVALEALQRTSFLRPIDDWNDTRELYGAMV
jgi:hypothetical protein